MAFKTIINIIRNKLFLNATRKVIRDEMPEILRTIQGNRAESITDTKIILKEVVGDRGDQQQDMRIILREELPKIFSSNMNFSGVSNANVGLTKQEDKFIYDSDLEIGNSKNKRCTIFAAFSNDGSIPDHVVYYLKKLKEISDYIIYVADNAIKNPSEIKKIEHLINHAYFYHHGCYDFGSFKIAYNYLVKNNLCENFEHFLFVNDSCYGPVCSLKPIINKMELKGTDFWGLVDSTDDVYHLLSFFLEFNKKVFLSDELSDFFETLPNKLAFEDAVKLGEKRLTESLKYKYSCDCFLPKFSTDNARSYSSGNRNGTVWPLSLLKAGFPLVKIKALRGSYGNELQESISDTLLYIKNNNIELYKLIINDLTKKNADYNYNFDLYGQDISEIIKNKKIISFDIFDTLLVRPFMNPSELFLFIEKENKIPGFYEERIKAEIRARKNSKYNEITIEEIYENILPEFKDVINIELDYEKRLLKKNPFIEKIYKTAVQSGLKIIAISDMYLSSTFLKEILKRNGFNDINDVYVSSDLRKTKGSAEIYEYVIKKYKISPKEMVHIGDNPVADKEIPEKLGINCYNIVKVTERFNNPGNLKWTEYYRCRNSFENGVFYSMIAKQNVVELKENHQYYEMLGYRLGGPLVLSYLNFILESAKRNNIKKLLFVARDGWILKEIYQKYLYNFYKIDSGYVYLQRVIGISSTLDYMNEPRYLRKLLDLYSENNNSICVTDNFNLNKVEYENNIEKLNIWMNKNKKEFKKHVEFEADKYDNLAIVDMTTGAFSSLTFAKNILGDRLKLAYFSGCFKNREDLRYMSFCRRLLTAADDPCLILSELLVSSPENNVVGLKDGKPVYSSKDQHNRAFLYNQIKKGIYSYVEDIISLFGQNYKSLCFRDFENWLDLATHYKNFSNGIDIYEQEKLYHTDEFAAEKIIQLKKVLE